MSGLIKPKKYDWKDSNLALFGSDTEKSIKKDSAQSEPAWQGAGEKVGLEIWRIVKFKVTAWPKEDYGKFYSGDSYIILNTYKPDPKGEDLDWDVHFWIGRESTQDEYASAAYKTVELDTFLDDAAVQHREVQGHESDMFLSYFKSITIMSGGAETGFRKVTPEEYKPRLLHFSGLKNHITVKEVPLTRSRLNANDVYILDKGNDLYQWNGSGCNKDEKMKAMQYLIELKSERGKSKSETLDETAIADTHAFYQALTEEDEDDEDITDSGATKTLIRVSDESGQMKQNTIKEGEVKLADFKSEDVFILDSGEHCFVWVGHGASPAEKQNGFSYATTYLNGTKHPFIPVVVLKEGNKNKDFAVAVSA